MSTGMQGSSRWSRVRAALGVYTAIKKRRASSSARAVRQLELTLLRGQEASLAAVVMAASSDDGDGKEKRRSVERAAGKWRGSTLAGYLRGDDCTFLENVRCTKLRFDDLVQRLRHSYLDVAEERSDHLPRAGAARVKKAHTRLGTGQTWGSRSGRACMPSAMVGLSRSSPTLPAWVLALSESTCACSRTLLRVS